MAVAQQGRLDPVVRRATASEPFRIRVAPDAFDLAVLVGFAALSAWILALDIGQVVAHGGVWAGTDGIFLQDQAMYLAWIRDASHHVLVSNLFVLSPTPHDYLQPAIAISGGLVALGMAPWVALIGWQPVALCAVFFAVRALIRRLLAGSVSRRTALVLALFGGSIGIAIFPDFWLPYWSWGYPFALLGLAFALGSLMTYSTGHGAWVAPLLAAMAAWLHPWMGEVLILIVLGAEGAMWASGKRPSFSRLTLLLAGIALPLAYYGSLAHFDPWWRLGENAGGGGLPLSTVAFTLAPLGLPALLAYRRRPATFLQAAVRSWPPAALIVFLLAAHGLGNSSMHGFLGIGVPLAVLAVEGVMTLPRPSFLSVPIVAVLATLAGTVPVTISSLKDSERYNRQSQLRNRVTHGEWRALGYLASDAQPGGVLTQWPTGVLVPGETGRHTYIGNLFWSRPNPERRAHLSELLLTGHMRPQRARAFVRSTGAHFLLADCGRQRRRVLGDELAPMVRSARRFGCATLYQLT